MTDFDLRPDNVRSYTEKVNTQRKISFFPKLLSAVLLLSLNVFLFVYFRLDFSLLRCM